jgi:DNA-directed RNA polymerase specialized sigma24 family protein
VQEQISGAEDLLHRNILKLLHHVKDIRPRERLRAWTLQVLVDGLLDGLALEQTEAQPEHKSGKRRVVIQHDSCLSPRLEYSPSFTEAAVRVGTVVHNTVRVDHIERIVQEGKVFRI